MTHAKRRIKKYVQKNVDGIVSENIEKVSVAESDDNESGNNENIHNDVFTLEVDRKNRRLYIGTENASGCEYGYQSEYEVPGKIAEYLHDYWGTQDIGEFEPEIKKLQYLNPKELIPGQVVGVPYEVQVSAYRNFRYRIIQPQKVAKITPKGTKIILDDGSQYSGKQDLSNTMTKPCAKHP